MGPFPGRQQGAYLPKDAVLSRLPINVLGNGPQVP